MEILKPVKIIAEVGVNHNGDIDCAKEMIDAAAHVCADAVKFQTFKTENLAIRSLEKETYQREACDDDENQFDMLKKLELSFEDTAKLKEYADSKSIEFLSTPYDYESLDFLDSLGVSCFKIGSGEITDLPFLEYVAGKRKPIILSTGAANMNEIDEAIKTIVSCCGELSLLHCTSAYPTAIEDVNLRAMVAMQKKFSYPIGFSDHTTGLMASIAAVSLGATIIERHFTLNKESPGPDHKASLDVLELQKLVQHIREIEIILGSSEKKPAATEDDTRVMGRRSIVAKKRIEANTVLTKEMLTTKRPAKGLAPKEMEKLIGKMTVKVIEKDCHVTFNDIIG